MATIEQIQGWVVHQNSNRELWVGHDNPEHLASMILEESQELADGIQEAMVTDEVWTVASEIGDIGYLLLKLCDQLGIDLNTAIEAKISRNSLKYPDHIMSNGRDYASARKVSKEAWEAMGGDSAFSHVYLDVLAHLEGE